MGNLLRKQKASWSVFNRDSLISIQGREILLLVVKTGAVLGVLNYFFYREWWAFVLLIPVDVLYFRLECGNLIRKKQDQVREQFVELLRFTVTSLRAGYSVENAFLDSYADLEKLYGERSVICKILRRFAITRQNHRPFAETWRMVGEELRVTEIREFSEIYETAYHHSGNLSSVMEQTSQIIMEKTELRRELFLLMASRRMELRIMTAMPFAIMAYIQWTSPGFFDELYHNTPGRMLMTGILFLYLTGYVWAWKITRMELSSGRKKAECLKEVYPEFVEKLRLYLVAGLNVRNAFLTITSLYAGIREKDRAHSYLLKELRSAGNQLANGIPEDEVYTQWGMHCEERSCRRLGFLLSVNLRKGNRQLLSCLEEEIRDTRQELQKKIRKKGEEASTKLLFPMILYLIIVMILVIYPAYQKLGGI